MTFLRRYWQFLLLGFVPIAVGLEMTMPENHTAIFGASVGNAAEHFSAVVLAADDQMDAAIGIAVGSSTQIALFVAPALVFLSYPIAPQPMDLLFTTYELVAIALSVLSIAFIAHDGETNWMEGCSCLRST
jgi:Ca2+:H+ antiporter